ncbi:SDR family oxidoreductase [Microlunatus sp. Gsoil 973]|jgi:uncharacterized protein YbjT (DUF2867 family)|uniref:SDR family oxidoreductase n=1 Tax=Microlunatus sp. Gsoil 973 TaxID=2672569 RepID=UPI0012B4EEAD|nr:SDR family oxidoreductase [Microlunatus sp. Gsoil 973]QGN32952.1 NAD(P)H-binding protein [Microlunatus sp. Gsoil 973]
MRIAVVGATGLVGSALVAAAREAGHDVIALSRETGTDVLNPAGLDQQLGGAAALINVVQSPSLEEEDSKAFFITAANNLAAAAKAAGVQRTVVLSIVGVDQVASGEDAGTGFDGYYRAKYAQELATTKAAPGARIVRSTQFHDIARQAIGWGLDGDRTVIPDLRIQPVAVPAMVEVLIGAATGEIAGEVIEVGGPGEEQVAELSARYAAHVGDPVTVVPGPVGKPVADGILLPHPGARLVGPSWSEWLETVPVPQRTA